MAKAKKTNRLRQKKWPMACWLIKKEAVLSVLRPKNKLQSDLILKCLKLFKKMAQVGRHESTMR